MSLKASFALQPAFGHPLLAPLVSTHASATQVSPPCEGGRKESLGRAGIQSRRNKNAALETIP